MGKRGHLRVVRCVVIPKEDLAAGVHEMIAILLPI
jgi:hypothetical protein